MEDGKLVRVRVGMLLVEVGLVSWVADVIEVWSLARRTASLEQHASKGRGSHRQPSQQAREETDDRVSTY